MTRKPSTSQLKPMPLAALLRARSHGGEHGQRDATAEATASACRQLVTQLGLLPTLQYLDDGLKRSRRGLSAYGDQLDACLQMVSGPILDTRGLIAQIDVLLAWVQAQHWPAGDPRMLPMARQSDQAMHPLAGYALSICQHWSNLFYTLDPVGQATGATADERAYEDLMEEFSMYVIAAQSTIPADLYLAFCRGWWKEGMQPEYTFYLSGRLASRVADASRAVRRLSRPEHADLFQQLRGGEPGVSFPDRIRGAMKRRWSDEDLKELERMGRLLEDVVPGWSSYHAGGHGRRTKRSRNTSPSRIVRRHFADGYVRVSESPCIAVIAENATGIPLETTVLRPQQPDELAAELMDSLGAAAIEASPFIFASGDPVQDAKALAQARLDGQEWMPIEEQVGGGPIESIVVSDAVTDYSVVPGIHPGAASRWAADYQRRALLAHRMVPRRLFLLDIQHVLDAMTDADIAPEDRPVMACLHAAIALGRPLEQACTLEVHTSLHEAFAEDRMHYALAEREWVMYAPPPAWGDEPLTRCERALWWQIRLRDRTGFFNLLTTLDLAHPGRPVRRLSEVRRKSITAWVQRQLPHLRKPLAACTQFLFDRLLELSGGDLGLARLLTGHEHAHSRSVAHYAHYDASIVWRAYQQCWQAGRDPAFNPAHRDPDAPAPDTAQRHGYGARRVPTIESVRDLVSGLRSRFTRGRGIERHNDYTAYTWVGLVLGTGLRPVTDPWLYAILPGVARQPLVTYIDKARSDYDQRINAIPPTLGKHLDRYAHHLRRLDEEAGPSAPPIVMPFRYRAPDTGAYRPFRSSDFAHLCSADFDLELYALRRFVRTELMSDPDIAFDFAAAPALRPTAEDVDAFMGHWFDGVSPHDPLSTYPAMRLQAVAQVAEGLLRAVGFKPLWMGHWRC